MELHKVTWYSKLLALILFVALPFLGFWAGMEYQKRISPPQNSSTTIKIGTGSAKSKGSSTTLKQISNDKLSITVIAKDGKVSYAGSAQVPDPCYEVKSEVVVLESFPEQVQIKLTTSKSDTSAVCAQVVTDKEFSGETQIASKKPTISISLNGEQMD